MTASLSVHFSNPSLTTAQFILNTSCHIEQPLGHGQFCTQDPSEWKPLSFVGMFYVPRKEQMIPSCASGHLYFTFWLSFPIQCCFSYYFVTASLTCCRAFTLYSQVHISLFLYTSLKIDVLRSSSMGWKWP